MVMAPKQSVSHARNQKKGQREKVIISVKAHGKGGREATGKRNLKHKWGKRSNRMGKNLNKGGRGVEREVIHDGRGGGGGKV